MTMQQFISTLTKTRTNTKIFVAIGLLAISGMFAAGVMRLTKEPAPKTAPLNDIAYDVCDDKEINSPCTSNFVPALTSLDLLEVNKKIANLNKTVSSLESEINTLNKDKNAKQAQIKIASLQTQLSKARKDIELANQSATLFDDELKAVSAQAKDSLCKLDQYTFLITNNLIPKYQAIGCQGEVAELETLKTKIANIKNSVLTKKDVDEVQSALLGFKEMEIENRLSCERADILAKLPTDLTNFSAKLDTLKSENTADKIQSFQTKASQIQSRINAIPAGKDRCNQIQSALSSQMKAVNLDLSDLDDRFKMSSAEQPAAQTAIPIVDESFSRGIARIASAFGRLIGRLNAESDESPEQPASTFTRVANAKGLVLFVQWADDPIEDVASVSREMRAATETLREFSYGRWTIDFDLCLASVRQALNLNLSDMELRNEFIRLCDHQYNYNNYDLLIFFPMNGVLHSGYYNGHINFETNDGPIHPGVISIHPGRFANDVLVHETGHYLGLAHAHSVECNNQVFGSGCSQGDEYGDVLDKMGSKQLHYNCSYKNKIGWGAAPIVNNSCSNVQNITISAIETPSNTSQCLLLPIDNSLTQGFFRDERVSTPCDNLIVEYRKPLGYDTSRLQSLVDAGYYSSLDNGGLVLRCATNEGRQHTWLLDCHPNSRSSSNDFKDAMITPGETCTTNLGYAVSFTPLSGNKANVRIEKTASFVNPPEICDNIDNDCNGTIDEGCDEDNDSFCDAAMTVVGTPSTCFSGGSDCNDDLSVVRPGALEICDNRDDDCDGTIDEGCDDDNDNYCDAAMIVVGTPQTCASGRGDCNDNLSVVRPGALEICDNRDNNCDGVIDEGCDDDNDNYCDAAKIVVGTPSTCRAGRGDADDDNTLVYPGAIEICDNSDNNSNNQIDEGCDDDRDNYCDLSITIIGTPTTCTAGGNDADDNNASVNPGVIEICDGIDNNSNGTADEGCDDDRDHYCDASMTTVGTPAVCPNGGGDCNDTVGRQHPRYSETCNDIDDDCDGTIDEGCDDDNDNHCDSAIETIGTPAVCPLGKNDCNDNDPTIIPLPRTDGTGFCCDSDGGVNPLIGGKTSFLADSGILSSVIERCETDGSSGLQEYSCNENNNSFTTVHFDCNTVGKTCIDPDSRSGPTPAYCGTP